MLSGPLSGQSWDFIKESNGIKIFTQKEAGKSLKSYKGMADINAPAEKIIALMKDINNTCWWDKNITQIKVLLNEKSEWIQYYLVYDLPWPITDRDLCLDVKSTSDKITGESRINIIAVPDLLPEHKNMVRIKNYRQTWIIIPAGKEMSHVILEGFIDPAGSVPDWLSNLLLVDSPLRSIKGLKKQIGEK
jgi:hypothetical protein